jgi:hypothetical protein
MNQDRAWAEWDGSIGERLGLAGIALALVTAAVLKERSDLG